MSYLLAAKAAEDQTFRLRIKAALFEIAQTVLAEPPSTTGHQRRVLMAQAVTRQPDDYVTQLAWLCGANPAVHATVTETGGVTVVAAEDATIRALCAAAWDAVAGVQATEREPA